MAKYSKHKRYKRFLKAGNIRPYMEPKSSQFLFQFPPFPSCIQTVDCQKVPAISSAKYLFVI